METSASAPEKIEIQINLGISEKCSDWSLGDMPICMAVARRTVEFANIVEESLEDIRTLAKLHLIAVRANIRPILGIINAIFSYYKGELQTINKMTEGDQKNDMKKSVIGNVLEVLYYCMDFRKDAAEAPSDYICSEHECVDATDFKKYQQLFFGNMDRIQFFGPLLRAFPRRTTGNIFSPVNVALYTLHIMGNYDWSMRILDLMRDSEVKNWDDLTEFTNNSRFLGAGQ